MSNIDVTISGRVATVTLNRPDKLNAFNPEMSEEFGCAFEALAKNDDVSCSIIRGAGRSFCVGADVSKGGYRDPAQLQDASDDWEHIGDSVQRWTSIWRHPKPVIAEVHGHCMGVATLLALACDITLVADNAVIGWPALPLGAGLLGPANAWLIGPKRAKELSFVVGSRISGQEAADWGWANRAYPEAELPAVAQRLAHQISKTPPDLLAIKKRAINRVFDMQGFSQSLMMGAEFDAIAHSSKGARDTKAMVKEIGLKAAMQRFKDEAAPGQ